MGTFYKISCLLVWLVTAVRLTPTPFKGDFRTEYIEFNQVAI